MRNAIRLIALKGKNVLRFIVLLTLWSHSAAQTDNTTNTVEEHARAHQYLYTNNNAFKNSTTALEVSSSGSARVIDTYSTGGAGAGGGYFALVAIASAHVDSNFCVFVSNGGDSTVAAFTIDRANGTLTTVSGSPFELGVTGAQPFGVGLAVGRNKLLFAGNSQFESISELKISSTCALKVVRTVSAPGSPVGLKVTPNGKFLIVSYPASSPPQPPQVVTTLKSGLGQPKSGLGQVDSFAINYTTGVLTELGPFNEQGSPGGVGINCDNSLVYFGDAGSETQVEVFSLNSSGGLTAVNNFTNSNGVNSNNVQLSEDDSTVYVSNTDSSQITALSASSNGGLTYATTTTLNGSPFFALGLGISMKGNYIFVSQINTLGEGVGVLLVDDTTLKEVPGSPFSVINNGNVPAFNALNRS